MNGGLPNNMSFFVEGYFDRETKIIITAWCLSQKLKELWKLEVVHFNDFIKILQEFENWYESFKIGDMLYSARKVSVIF